ncbi:MAG: Ig-like domain-containing protein [Acidobacteria bacterium]|nr:Ig-like domain-containing protein [Acidobacteriota bacterium]
MIKNKLTLMVLFLIIALLVAIIPTPIYAKDKEINKYLPNRFQTSYMLRNIGTIEAFGKISVNGQVANQKSTFNSGDYLQTGNYATATLSIDSSGKVILGQNTSVYFAVSKILENNGTEKPILIATLVKGSLNVRLNNQSQAYVESGGLIFTAEAGTSFRASNYNGQLEVLGDVNFQNNRQYIVRPVEVGATLSVKARSTRQIQIQVTDENDRPVPDVPIIFTLGSQLGKFGSTNATTTNSQGIASINFTAGNSPGTTSITATVKDTNYSWTGEISVFKAGFWSTRNKVLVTTAAIAAGTLTGVVVSQSGNNRKASVVAQTPIITPK